MAALFNCSKYFHAALGVLVQKVWRKMTLIIFVIVKFYYKKCAPLEQDDAESLWMLVTIYLVMHRTSGLRGHIGPPNPTLTQPCRSR